MDVQKMHSIHSYRAADQIRRLGNHRGVMWHSCSTPRTSMHVPLCIPSSVAVATNPPSRKDERPHTASKTEKRKLGSQKHLQLACISIHCWLGDEGHVKMLETCGITNDNSNVDNDLMLFNNHVGYLEKCKTLIS